VYGFSELHQIKNGFIYANIKENISRFLELYTIAVTVAKTVFKISKKKVIQTDKNISLQLPQSKYLPDNITK
jgi:hypothetical protein